MTLILSNEEIDDLLEMDELIRILEDSYLELAQGRGGSRRRSDIVTPTTLRDDGLSALKPMDGVIPKLGVGAIRLNSDILTFPQSGNEMRRVKVPAAPGKSLCRLSTAVQHPYWRAPGNYAGRRDAARTGRRDQRYCCKIFSA